MAFFDPLPEPGPDVEERPYVARPGDPPVNFVPVALPDVVVLARTPVAAVYASGFDVFPQGLRFGLVALARPDEVARWERAQGWRPAGELRFGVLLPDGTKLFGDANPGIPQQQGAQLVAQGGGGNPVSQRMQYWLWPLPPAGPIELVCSWPQYDIDEARGVLNTGDLTRIASGARELWPVTLATEAGERLSQEDTGRAAPAAQARPSGRRRPTVAPPDTRELTAVVAQPCPQCGFDSTEPSFREIPKRLWTEVASWARALDGAETPRHRPQLEVWALVEQASQIRDACLVYAARLRLMLTQDDPQFPALTQDDRAERYQFAEPDAVARDLIEAAETIISVLESVRPDQLGRTGRRANGERYTVDSLARYVLHDVVHHCRAAGIS